MKMFLNIKYKLNCKYAMNVGLQIWLKSFVVVVTDIFPLTVGANENQPFGYTFIYTRKYSLNIKHWLEYVYKLTQVLPTRMSRGNFVNFSLQLAQTSSMFSHRRYFWPRAKCFS